MKVGILHSLYLLSLPILLLVSLYTGIQDRFADGQAMGRLVKELAKCGYVSIHPEQTDNRAQQVRLTDRGCGFLTYLATTPDDLIWSGFLRLRHTRPIKSLLRTECHTVLKLLHSRGTGESYRANSGTRGW